MNLNDLIAALHDKQWVLSGALVVTMLVALTKQGWAGAWIAKKLPPVTLPYLAVVLGAVGLSAAEVIAGKPLAQAIVDGIESGVGAVFLHQTVVEGGRSGKEIFPEKLPKLPPAPPPQNDQEAA
jgi:hypothetical protein